MTKDAEMAAIDRPRVRGARDLYLIWLGIQAIRHRGTLAGAFGDAAAPRGGRGLAMIRVGVTVAVTGRKD